ncbi:hypothetical protein M501DRAFT_951753 [Patellaria atrata CBS 101060]|uniref:N-acetylglucosamine-induced protein 1 n=1 Tax=Patellaria atrata CBS 101060 TaxID=1346257 RepID=A0A9P4SEF1_9PEZI|nr:hypothetical protein M501DRAFT_951753 [Patellaria atrata CBS 101060]
MPHEELLFWKVNLPRDKWPPSCPDFLLDVSEKDRRIIGTLDEEYHRTTWEEVKELIRTNRIDLFQRLPSDLRNYRKYMHKLKQDYGSVMNFVITQRLDWVDMVPIGKEFEKNEDIKILYNDWPYGVDPEIVHLVIWTKFELEDDPNTDDLTPKARKKIDEFVRRKFCQRVDPEHVMWFKNWRSLKSVNAVEHFHVMLYRPDPAFVEEITNGDIPLVAQVKDF